MIILAIVVVALISIAGAGGTSSKIRFVQTAANPPLLLAVELSKRTYILGETLSARFTLTNTALWPIEIVFSSSKTFDFFVRDTDGGVIYQWSWDKMFLQMLSPFHLNPFESISRTLSWTPNVAGWFTLTGFTATFGIGHYGPFNLATQPIVFEIQD